jgi:hypothetical protein
MTDPETGLLTQPAGPRSRRVHEAALAATRALLAEAALHGLLAPTTSRN